MWVAKKLVLGAMLATPVSWSLGALIGSQWIEVDNQFFPGTTTNSGLANGSLNGTKYRTFDLYVTSDVPIIVVDSGVTQSSGANAGISLSSGFYFQRTVSGNANQLTPAPVAVLTDPLLNYDTYFGVGNRPASSIVVTAPIMFTSTHATGTWAVSGGASAAPDEFDRVFAGRFTVPTTSGFRTDESVSRHLEGSIFVFPAGATHGQVVQLTNAYATCLADFNNDRQVDDLDFQLFVAAYNLLECSNPAMPKDCPADMDRDGVVDDRDFQIFVLGYNVLLCP